jgi:hypothetical protein
MKTIAFYDNNLCLRGTSVALYQYALYNELILGNKSIIISQPHGDLSAIDKFQKKFDVKLLQFNTFDYEKYLLQNNVDFFYAIKAGNSSDGLYLNNIPTLVHCVFTNGDIHGHRYAFVSDWLCKHSGYDPEQYSVPHIAEKLPDTSLNLREKLGIPDKQTVFGCYAGSTEFNIPFVHQTIEKILSERNDITFLFMNINRFSNIQSNNLIFLDGTHDLHFKSSFVNCCDAMIHARSGGETFGCAVAEFSMSNKPVITYELSGEQAHIDILKNRAILYDNEIKLYDILNNLTTYIKYDDYYKAYENYSADKIMNKFNRIFLNG